MPYIGNTAADRFVASKAATQFSGDGSTTAFTLEHSVGADEDILVSVDGVVQEPSVAYAVSNGTTLTFTAAPSSNSGNNIFVYYLFRTVGTVSHPSNQALSATSGTFSSTLNVTGETTLATHLNLGDDDKIKLGASGDLEIYHDTGNGNSVIHDTGSGNLRIRADDFQVTNAAASANLIFANDANGEVKLYHNGSEKIATSSAGATLTGNLTVTDGHVSSGVTHTYNLFGATGTGGSASYVTYSFVGDPNTGMFSGTADTLKFATGGSERMRLTPDSSLLLNKTADDIGTAGVNIAADGGFSAFTRSNDPVLYVRRNTSDGVIINLMQDSGTEGSISVSGTVVSYNSFSGSHWSRLTDNSKPTILKGTIIETIDEMCDWYRVKFTIAETEEVPERIEEVSVALPSGKSVGDTMSYTHEGITYDNAVIVKEEDEKHPKCKISDTSDSKRVYGVHMAWDNDDDTVNDMYVTAVGTHVVRINKDVTVQAGDLLSSNGDGTAKVQDDDIIRSKTIGKVLTNIKQETYSDGSYTVPCALYCG